MAFAPENVSPRLAELFDGTLERFAHEARSVPSPQVGFALPDASLDFLRRVIEALGVERVLEFGSGRSTAFFLERGVQVTTIDDDVRWLAAAIDRAPPDRRSSLHALHQRLVTRFDRLAPYRGWRLGADTVERLRRADLVLIDAPVLASFREIVLIDTLRHAEHALVVVDDARDDALRNACIRLATANGLPWSVADIDHRLFLTTARAHRSLRTHRGMVETLQVWQRLLCFVRDVLVTKAKS